MINILFDHQKFSTQRYGGISRYFANLLLEIKSSKDFQYEIGVLFSKNHYLNNEQLYNKSLILEQFFKIGFENKIYNVNKLYSEFLLSKNKFDIFHPTYYDPYSILKIKKPTVVTVHDMTYERFPQYFWSADPLTYQKRLSIENADHIIAISESTKDDMMEFLNVAEDKITVIHHGINLDEELKFEIIPDIPEDFLLYVGDRGGYKNFYLFIDACTLVLKSYPNLKILLTGGGDLQIAEIEYLKRSQLTQNVSHVNVSDNQLNYLYHKAILFVYPSLYEGFGLPILEAFKAGCPILLSDILCFREVAGDAAIYFDPFSVAELSAAILRLLSDPGLRHNITSAATHQIKKFSIRESNFKTLEVYKRLV